MISEGVIYNVSHVMLPDNLSAVTASSFKHLKASSLWQPPMTSEVMMLLKSQICLSRAIQNGMTLEYWIKIEVSRPDLSKFI